MNKEKGQVFPLTALMLVLLIGAAALAIDASMAHSQQRRQQQDLDTVTKLAATGYTYAQAKSFLQARGYDTSGFKLQSVSSGPYAGRSVWPDCVGKTTCYVESYLNQNLRSYFGKVLGFGWMHVSVHSVAEAGGTTYTKLYPAVLGLDPNGCAISLNSGAATVTITSNVGLNSGVCLNNNSQYTVHGSTNVATCPNCYSNPFWPSGPIPTSALPARTWTSNNWPGWLTDSCRLKDKLPPIPVRNVVYEFPADTTSVTIPYISGSSAIKGYTFLPSCDSSSGIPVQTPGIYYFSSDPGLSSQTAVTTQDSTLVFGPGVSETSTGQVTWDLNAPTSGIFYDSSFGQGIAVYEDVPAPAPPCTSNPTFDFYGTVDSQVSGIIAVPCGVFSMLGNSVMNIGAIAAWQIAVTGTGNASIWPPHQDEKQVVVRGAVLVQ